MFSIGENIFDSSTFPRYPKGVLYPRLALGERRTIMSPGNNMVRVLIVDDQFIVRQTFRCILKHYANIEVVGEASDGDEAIAYTGRFQPAVVVMDIHMKKVDGITDIHMKKVDGITAARLIKTQYPHVLVLGFSADVQSYNVSAMQQAGAFEVLRKEDAMNNLYAAIQRGVAATQPKAA
jgi:DNA-binding NarL/FixJ family response regulator